MSTAMHGSISGVTVLTVQIGRNKFKGYPLIKDKCFSHYLAYQKLGLYCLNLDRFLFLDKF